MPDQIPGPLLLLLSYPTKYPNLTAPSPPTDTLLLKWSQLFVDTVPTTSKEKQREEKQRVEKQRERKQKEEKQR